MLDLGSGWVTAILSGIGLAGAFLASWLANKGAKAERGYYSGSTPADQITPPRAALRTVSTNTAHSEEPANTRDSENPGDPDYDPLYDPNQDLYDKIERAVKEHESKANRDA